jgi:lipoprotein-anchoring transpeptidase ErfK/SrfK
MSVRLPYLLALPLAMFMANCTTSLSSSRYNGSASKIDSAYQAFQARPDYRETSEIYRNESLLRHSNPQSTRVTVNLKTQRAVFRINGAVALDAPCSTGRPGKSTPTGSFAISEKKADKRSTIFGKVYRNGRVVKSGDCRGYSGSSGFVGASLPYWMRLNNDGIGLHASSSIARTPRSNGCVRLPMEAVKTIYENAPLGTVVDIIP